MCIVCCILYNVFWRNNKNQYFFMKKENSLATQTRFITVRSSIITANWNPNMGTNALGFWDINTLIYNSISEHTYYNEMQFSTFYRDENWKRDIDGFTPVSVWQVVIFQQHCDWDVISSLIMQHDLTGMFLSILPYHLILL